MAVSTLECIDRLFFVTRKFSTACLNRSKMNCWTEKKNLPRQQK